MLTSIKQNCAKGITVVLGYILGLALFSGVAQVVTCTPTGAAAAEANVTFAAAINICGVTTTIDSPTSVEGYPLLIFTSFPSNGSGNTAVEGERDYSARVDQLLLDLRIITRTQSQSHVSIFHTTVKLPTFFARKIRS